MARKAKRRVFRRPLPQRRVEDRGDEQRRLAAAAERLLATMGPEQLHQALLEREALLAEADRAAQLDPSPAQLSRYRLARAEYDATRIALELLRDAERA